MIARTQEMFSSMIYSSHINIHIFHIKMKLKLITSEGDCGMRTNYQIIKNTTPIFKLSVISV